MAPDNASLQPRKVPHLLLHRCQDWRMLHGTLLVSKAPTHTEARTTAAAGHASEAALVASAWLSTCGERAPAHC